MVSIISMNLTDRRPHRLFSPRGYQVWPGIVAIVAMIVLLLPFPTPSEPNSTAPRTPVRGEIVMLTAQLLVVKSAEGTSILIPLGEHATVDRKLKTGDRVEVVMTRNQQFSSVRKIAS
jgi:hypothetical protein